MLKSDWPASSAPVPQSWRHSFRPQTQTLSTRTFVSCQFNRVAPWTFGWRQQLIQRLQTFPNSLENSSKDRPKEKTWVKIFSMLEYGDGHHGPLGFRFLSYPSGLRFLFANSDCELWMLVTRKSPLQILITVERKKKTPSNLKMAKLIMISWVDLLIAANNSDLPKTTSGEFCSKKIAQVPAKLERNFDKVVPAWWSGLFLFERPKNGAMWIGPYWNKIKGQELEDVKSSLFSRFIMIYIIYV